MKHLLLTLTFAACLCLLHAQTERFDVSIEYTPNYSKLTDNFSNPGFNFSHQFFTRAEWNLSRRFGVSIGLGYMNARDRWTVFLEGQNDIDYIELYTNHDYITIPVGLKYNFGSWYVRPEISIGLNFSNPGRLMRQVTFKINGEKIVSRWDDFNQRNYNDLSFPIFFSVGREFKVKTLSVQLGVKGFYSLEQVVLENYWIQHYIGLGVLAGIRF